MKRKCAAVLLIIALFLVRCGGGGSSSSSSAPTSTLEPVMQMVGTITAQTAEAHR